MVQPIFRMPLLSAIVAVLVSVSAARGEEDAEAVSDGLGQYG